MWVRLFLYGWSSPGCDGANLGVYDLCHFGDRSGLSIAKNRPKPSQKYSEQLGPSAEKMKGFSRRSPQKDHLIRQTVPRSSRGPCYQRDLPMQGIFCN